ncbi:MAG: hypothetical protein OXR73_05830 [Myxococcales bacterium]|nr:hypothetical protein [Myxococcales bacterium]
MGRTGGLPLARGAMVLALGLCGTGCPRTHQMVSDEDRSDAREDFEESMPSAGPRRGSSEAPATTVTAGAGAPRPRDGTSSPGDQQSPPGAPPALDPEVDWEALSITRSPMYSAYDGVHTFSLPAHVPGISTHVEQWKAEPADAVAFKPWQSADGAEAGVLITVMRFAPAIEIAVNQGPVGGRATLFVTRATPEAWEVGRRRYQDAPEFEMDAFAALDELGPVVVDGKLPAPLPDLRDLGIETRVRCDSCHTTAATNFQVEHNPAQIAGFSDEALIEVITEGQKPDGVGLRALPERMAGLFRFMHRWPGTGEEAFGLVVYLRSQQPRAQGDVILTTFPRSIDLPALPAVCNPNSGMFDFQLCQQSLPEVCMAGSPDFDTQACREILMSDGMMPDG